MELLHEFARPNEYDPSYAWSDFLLGVVDPFLAETGKPIPGEYRNEYKLYVVSIKRADIVVACLWARKRDTEDEKVGWTSVLK